jgi:hypothetical protein
MLNKSSVFPFVAPIAEYREIEQRQHYKRGHGTVRKNNRKSTRGRHTQYIANIRQIGNTYKIEYRTIKHQTKRKPNE